VIDGIDESLRAMLLVFLGEDAAEIRFEAPNPELGAKGPVVDVFLYDVADELDGLHADYWDVRDDGGKVVARQGGIHRIRFSYLVTAFAKDVAHEHRLLGKVLRGVVENPVVPRALLVGELAEEAQPTQLRVARPLETGRPKPHELFPALGLPARSSLELEVVAPLRPTPLVGIAPPAKSIDLGFDRGYRGVPSGTMVPPPVPAGLAAEAAAAAAEAGEAGGKSGGRSAGKAKTKPTDEEAAAAAARTEGFVAASPPGPGDRKWTAFRIREKTD
jgi:hypothetical protein